MEDQIRAEERIPILLKIPAARRFLSCEPLLGPVDISPWTNKRSKDSFKIDWVIAGGESGPGARAMLPGWAMQLRDQCQKSDTPFHFKQWGHWAPVPAPKREKSSVQKFWDDVIGSDIFMEAKGKKVAGRRLDGITWDELPASA